MHYLSRIWFVLLLFGYPAFLAASEPLVHPIRIYLDSDFSVHTASSQAIEMGIRQAFHERGNQIQGRPVRFVLLDHRGNSIRSKMNLQRALEDEHALFVLAGYHSPPLLKNRAFINKHKILTLVPWAAAGPITRTPGPENWIFRLSLDDRQVGTFIANYSMRSGDCKSPHLLLEKTPWGESNLSTMSRAIEKLYGHSPGVAWYNWGVSKQTARIKLRGIAREGFDCILFVGNATDATSIVIAMGSLPAETRLPIYSHWGITGGKFQEKIPAETLKRVQLKFIQTCFSFVSSEPHARSRAVFEQAKTLFPNLNSLESLKAPTGFIHAYDLGRVVLKALDQIKLTQNAQENRENLRHALENIYEPVEGLIKTYRRPFRPPSRSNPYAHEALDASDYCMARYGKNKEIVVYSDD